MSERLQKLIASAGLGSRRQAETLIQAGQVTVNGQRALLGDQADPTVDVIEVNGRRLPPANGKLYFALNKPTGYVTTLARHPGERTVRELMPRGSRIVPVGRLDQDTSGLLLLTNDGEWSNIVTHPRYGVDKEYRIVVRGLPDRAALDRLRSGVRLPDGSITEPSSVTVLTSRRDAVTLRITVIQGKKRQLRHMCAAVGHPVIDLQRVRVGPILLDGLAPGEVRPLVPEEICKVYEFASSGHASE